MTKGTTLTAFLESNTNVELCKVLLSIAEGSKIIGKLINNAGIADILGVTGETNVQGETVQKLDDLSNRIIMDYLRASEACAGYLSEENEGVVTFNTQAKYIISVDPLDGSSNIDICAPVGTIFNIVERISPAGAATEADFFQPGTQTKSAGYFIYGSSTILILSTGSGVNGFTLNTSNNQYYLSHPDIKIPADGKIYSLNQGNISKFDEPVKNYIAYCTDTDKATSRPYSQRYIGSMVGDIQRTLIKGGIFIYPASKGEAKGKLRLLYECIPMSYIAEQAGGKGTDGRQRILDIVPTELHERSAIFIGSKNMVDKAQEFMKGSTI
ncbi:MAG TPA: class 1 fructose-bisphosphatase [Chitinophagales bacterium]|nr:class 1 fructose-bisphosphatase [Chitinophagales bacterium]